MNSPCGSNGALPPSSTPNRSANDLIVLPERFAQIRRAPGVEGPFHWVHVFPGRRFRRHAVGVLGRVEPAFRAGQLAADILQRVVGHLREEAITGRLRGLEIRQHELRLVVEHLLEVRHPPVAVHRVAMEPAADMVAHAAERHRAQREQHHVPRLGVAGARVLAQQEQQLARARELRLVAESAAPGVERHLELTDTDRERVRACHGGRPVVGRRLSLTRRNSSTSAAADFATRRRSSAHARAIVCSTSTNPGRPQRASGGK